MPEAASDNKALRLNMAPPDYFAIDFPGNREIPWRRRLPPYYRPRGLCQAAKTAVHEAPRAGVGGVMRPLRTRRNDIVQNLSRWACGRAHSPMNRMICLATARSSATLDEAPQRFPISQGRRAAECARRQTGSSVDRFTYRTTSVDLKFARPGSLAIRSSRIRW
jgi:hypothetical protein